MADEVPRRSLIGRWRLAIDYRIDLAKNPRYQPEGELYRATAAGFSCHCGGLHSDTGVNWSGVDKPIVFTYRQGTVGLGNVLLRGFQVADLLAQLGSPVPVTVQAMENLYRAKPRDHIIIVLKSAVRPKSTPVLKAFRRWGNTVLFDVVDGLVPESLARVPHAYVCASLTEEQSRQGGGHRTIRSLQSPDQRTPAFDFADKKPRVAYYGLAENAKHLDALPEVDVIDFEEMPAHRSNEPIPTVFEKLRPYSHHYTVRAWNDRDGFKPMMKGYFAGLLGSVVIASAEDDESLLVLGDDYPYLSADSSLPAVRDTITFAMESVGTDTWTRAVSTMQRLREMSCPIVTARSLIEGLRTLD